jgi:hypothetical protein
MGEEYVEAVQEMFMTKHTFQKRNCQWSRNFESDQISTEKQWLPSNEWSLWG